MLKNNNSDTANQQNTNKFQNRMQPEDISNEEQEFQ
jgi:hypothetical protein